MEKPTEFAASPEEGNLMHWKACIFGPEQTEWQGAVFKLTLDFTSEYPAVPPTVKFADVIPFHPNIYQNGKICIDLLQHNWSPAYDVSAILTSLVSLLVDPNPNSPANNEAAELWVKNHEEYKRMARKSVEASWKTQ